MALHPGLFASLLLVALVVDRGAGAPGAEPARPEFTRLVAHWAEYGHPDYVPFVDEADPARRAAEQASLRNVTDQLRVKPLEIRVGQRAKSPHLAAAHIEDAPGAIKVPGKIDRQIVGKRGARIGVPPAGRDAHRHGRSRAAARTRKTPRRMPHSTTRIPTSGSWTLLLAARWPRTTSERARFSFRRSLRDRRRRRSLRRFRRARRMRLHRARRRRDSPRFRSNGSGPTVRAAALRA